MSFMDELNKLIRPYNEDDDDFFEGADPSFKKAAQAAAPKAKDFQADFEATFGEEPSANPEPAARKSPKASGGEGSIFGGFGIHKTPRQKPQREKVVSFGGNETQVILFNPKSFNEAYDLIGHLQQNRSVLMTLEGVQEDLGRRLLDFQSGISYALNFKIIPVSAKTYFITPKDMDIMGAQPEQPQSDEQYF